jgi:hypothetical protein
MSKINRLKSSWSVPVAALLAVAASACSEEGSRRFGALGLGGDDDLIREVDEDLDLREGTLHLPFAGHVKILYARVDGRAVWSGDILLDEAELQGFRAAATTRLWPNRTVKYALDASLPAATKTGVLQAMQTWKARADVRFVEVEPQGGGYLLIQRGNKGCSAHLGYYGDAYQHELNLAEGCEDASVYEHELGHVLGLFHEQSRSDRDDHVTIHWDNIQPGYAFAFDKYEKTDSGKDRGSYDYVSIMHYGSDAFAIDPAKRTIVRKDGGLIGWAPSISHGDATAVKTMYAEQPEQDAAADDPNGPGDGCAGLCGSLEPTAANCYCDAGCAEYGDCCPDQPMVCGAPPANGVNGQAATCDGRCDSPEGQPDGNGSHCYCDDACVEHDDCCSDRAVACDGGGDGGGGGAATCVGHCGGHGSEGESCWCDDECTTNGDCCSDHEAACGGDGGGGAASCVGHCNSTEAVDGCYCEPSCVQYGDCCANYLSVCQ